MLKVACWLCTGESAEVHKVVPAFLIKLQLTNWFKKGLGGWAASVSFSPQIL